MKLNQNDLDILREKIRQGELTADEANVLKVRMQRVLLVTSRIPQEARSALNKAVKRGELGHVKKDRLKPEAYFHPTFEYLVPGERNQHERATVAALRKVYGVTE